MKKIAALLLILSVLIALVSCALGAPSETTASTTEATTTPEATTVQTTTAETTTAETTTAETTTVPEPGTDYRRGLYDFADLSTDEPDYAAIDKLVEELEAAVAGEDSALVLELFDKLDEALSMVQSALSVNEIYQNLDNTDTALTEKIERIDATYQAYINTMMAIGRKILLESPHADAFKAEYSEEDVAYILETGEYLDDEYVAMQTELGKLENEYYALENTVTVTCNGVECSLEGMIFVYQKGGITYEKAIELLNEYMKNYATAAGDIYLRQLAINKKIAAKMGYDTYSEYAYDRVFSRSYSPAEIAALRTAVKEYIVPVKEKLEASLTAADSSTLQYYYYTMKSQLAERSADLETYLEELSPDAIEAYRYLNDYHLFVGGNEANMQESGYTKYLYRYDLPVIYIYRYGGVYDLNTFVHEFGHFMASYLNGSDSSNDLDLNEVQSQTNELLFMEYYAEMFPDVAELLEKHRITEKLSSVVMGCMMDEFEAEVYALENPTVEDMNAIFKRLIEDYHFDDSSFQYDAMYYWAEIPHIFIYPFYYISYGVSAVPALEIYEKSLTDRDAAIETYMAILNCTEDETFADAITKTGLVSPFEGTTIEDLASFILKRYAPAE